MGGKILSFPKLSYSMREARAATGVGDHTLRAAIREGHLKIVQVGLRGGQGRKILITAESLEAWVRPPEAEDDHAA